MNQLHYITTNTHEEWLEQRKKGIGGSDVPAILNQNSYLSRYELWCDKQGLLKPKEENEAMRQGHDFEDYVAKRFTEATGKKVRRRNHTIINDAFPFAHANVDRWVVGENAGLEIKTTSPYNESKLKDGEYPIQYYFQCLHYMAVTGAAKWYLAVLVFQRGFKWYEIERDEEAIANLMKVEKDFWWYVENKIPPEVDGSTSTSQAQNERFLIDADDEEVMLFGLDEKINKLNELKLSQKTTEQEIRKIEQEIKEEIGPHSVGLTQANRITYKPQTRRTFQVKEFIKDNPELDLSNYYKETTTKVFRIKEIK